MPTLDLSYLCRMLSELSGVPVRLYAHDERIAFFSPVTLAHDPYEICRAEVEQIAASVGYYIMPHDYVYGVLRTGDHRIVIGPTAEIPPSDRALRELAFLCGVSKGETASFLASMRAIVPHPRDSLLSMLLPFHYVLNGEKRELIDLTINPSEQTEIKQQVEHRRTQRLYDAPPPVTHNSVEIEQTLTDIVRHGDSEALRLWTASAPTVRSGILAGDQLRQMRNLLIVTATLVSRAAIEGGMTPNEAYALSDAYIQRVEKLTSQSAITNLQFHMITEFTERVGRLRQSDGASKLRLAAMNYVQQHLSEPIKTADLAKELFLSRTYLSAKFKEETGETLTDFILGEKTTEAKRLLRYSDRSISAIGAYLGFSSPGHFSRVFKKYTGITPNEYRERSVSICFPF